MERLANAPTFEQSLEDAVERRLQDLHTCMPGKVVRVNVELGQCDVQPVLRRRYVEGTLVDIPVITNVPIANYRAGTAFISLPVKVGDLVELRFCERSMDIWLSKGGSVDPKDPRKFDLSDAIAYPGCYPFTDPPTGAHSTNIVIKNSVGRIEVTPAGKFLFQGSLFELMTSLVALTDVLIALKTIDPLSGSNALTPDTITALQDIKTQLSSMKV